jgi:hypothetical protein
MKLHSLAFLVIALAACNASNSDVNTVDQGVDISAQSIDGTNRQIPSAGTANLRSIGEGSDTLQWPEFGPTVGDEGSYVNGVNRAGLRSQSLATRLQQVVNRSRSARGAYVAASAAPTRVEGQGVMSLGSRTQKLLSFDGVNLRDQRLANGGNQFTVEPPDQALCVGNGFVLESVNDVLRVYDTAGNPRTGVIDLNTFYGYAAAFDRTKVAGQPRFGPSITDPVCHYDPDTKRWFHVVLTLETDAISGDLTFKNSLDVAVSDSADPTAGWHIYRVPVQNDGTDGTPNHGCSKEADPSGNPVGNGPCIGDYPHIGADANGIYVTTNEYSFGGPEFKSANVYAFSKRALASGAASIRVVEFETVGAVNGKPGFTVWPAISPKNDDNDDYRGTEYFMSSNAAEEANGTGVSNEIVTWALVNTRSLDARTARVKLFNTVVPVTPYGVPPRITQKAGDFPVGQCINDTTLPTPFGPGCWQLFFNTQPPAETLSKLDGNDSRMQQVSYADGRLYGALDTAFSVGGTEQVGIVYFILNPRLQRSGLSAKVKRQGYVVVAGNSVTRPAIAVTRNGKGVMGMTLVGPDYHPSAAYAAIDEESGVGSVQVAELGKGPQDGFSGYNAFAASGVARPRWGDYGAAATDGNTIWVANEYIAQTCTLAQYFPNAPSTLGLGSCGGTRVTLGNWATRVTQVKP